MSLCQFITHTIAISIAYHLILSCNYHCDSLLIKTFSYQIWKNQLVINTTKWLIFPCIFFAKPEFHPRSSSMAACCSSDQIQSVLANMEMSEWCWNTLSLDNEHTKILSSSFDSIMQLPNAHKIWRMLICICFSITLEFPSKWHATRNFCSGLENEIKDYFLLKTLPLNCHIQWPYIFGL